VGSEKIPAFKGFAYMNIIIFTPSIHVEKLKQKAKKLKKELGISHHEALDQIAKQFRYHHWHHVTEMAAITAPTEEAYRNGVLVAYDFSDISDCYMEESPFVEDNLAMYFCEDQLWQAYLEIDDDEEPEFHDLPEEERREYFADDYGRFVILRFTGADIPQDVEYVLKLTRKFTFWPPQFVWIKGNIYNTYGAPVTSSNGEIVGVRF